MMSFTPRRQIRRARSLRGADKFKFVRQAPIGPHIVDFLCREARLIVEVDGATHSEDREIA
jgi:very-short-patch-repair endonuclease